MIPFLLDTTYTTSRSVTNSKVGQLTDCIKCVVTEERNGTYYLNLTYPRDGRHAGEICCDYYIVAKPNDLDEYDVFKITSVDGRGTNSTISVRAEQVGQYYARKCRVLPFETKRTGSGVFSAILARTIHTKWSSVFNLSTDMSFAKGFNISSKKYAPKSLRDVLFGSRESIIDVYGGELHWNCFNVQHKSARGSDDGVSITSRKNLLSFKFNTDIEDRAQCFVYYWKKKNSDEYGYYPTSASGYTTDLEIEGSDECTAIDVTDLMNSDGTITHSSVISAVTNDEKNIWKEVMSNIDVDFVALEKTEEYKDVVKLRSVNLCDTVTVYYEPLGISVKEKVVKAEYDVLLERYGKITLGAKKLTLFNALNNNDNVASSFKLEG